MKRATKKAIQQITFLCLGMVILLTTVSLYQDKEKTVHTQVANEHEHVFSKSIEKHREAVTKYAKKYDVEEYVDVLLAMMMQESGGRGDDPMQSSESLCGSIGCINDPEASIEQGVDYFSTALKQTDGDVELAVQAYNFGIGFIDYVEEQGASYTQDIAIEFSKMMYDNAEDKSIYTCLRKEAKQYDACYGDIYYARDVMAYKNKFANLE